MTCQQRYREIVKKNNKEKCLEKSRQYYEENKERLKNDSRSKQRG